MQFKQKNLLMFLKRGFQRTFLHYGHTYNYATISNAEASEIVFKYLSDDQPRLICRFGSTELQCLAAHLREISWLKNFKPYKYFHWDDAADNIFNLSGVFPKEDKTIHNFCQLFLEDIPEIDVLGTWRKEEYYLKKYLKGIEKIELPNLEPYFEKQPWSRILEGKKVLVIHPFAETIKSQYKKRELLFKNKLILPEFELATIKAVQSLGGDDQRFKNWFQALDFMKSQIDSAEFDIALLGCGAYGFPLGAHIKRIGKKALHMGGALQLLFGIKGKRWVERESFFKLMNEYWVYPDEKDVPRNSMMVENACYWK